jgi:hypothetical protein
MGVVRKIGFFQNIFSCGLKNIGLKNIYFDKTIMRWTFTYKINKKQVLINKK